MKRFTLLLALVLGVGLSAVHAQKCSKSAKASCAKSAESTAVVNGHCSGAADAAAKLASLDASIETRTCEKSGMVSYVRKVVNQESGEVTYTDVRYDSELGTFVNVSPSEAKLCCAKAATTGCCVGKSSKKTALKEIAKQPAPQPDAVQRKS